MKHFKMIILVTFLTLSAQISMGQFTSIAADKVNQQNKEVAAGLAKKIMEGMKSGSYYILSEDEAIPAVVKGLTEQTQLAVYEQVSGQFGDFEDLHFVEAMKNNDNQDYIMYRFRGVFSDAKKGPEIRVVLNLDQKLAGFWILPWEDKIGSTP